jgi:hypothetical protein
MYLSPFGLPELLAAINSWHLSSCGKAFHRQATMATTCQASSDILAFNDEDIATIRRSDTTKKVLERDIDIGLKCEISLENPSFRNGKLHISNWRVGTTEICGACIFCNLLLDGLQRTLSSTSCDWKIGSGSAVIKVQLRRN